jgi:aryl-alcohol dehydrogenase-like predicted oxidoreductase
VPAASALLATVPGGPVRAAVAPSEARTVRFPDDSVVPAVGQGAWHLGQGRHSEAKETEALRTGVSLGMKLIDTSGNSGDGRSEAFIGRALGAQRDTIYLVSKVEVDEVSGDGIPVPARRASRACAPIISTEI